MGHLVWKYCKTNPTWELAERWCGEVALGGFCFIMTIGPYSTMELNKGLSCPTSISIMLQINVPHIKSIQGIGLLI